MRAATADALNERLSPSRRFNGLVVRCESLPLLATALMEMHADARKATCVVVVVVVVVVVCVVVTDAC